MSGLTAGCVREFVDERRARGLKCHISPRALGWLTDYLGGLGVLPAPAPAEILPAEALLERYRQYLLRERGLAAGTAVYYLYVARRFLAATSPGTGDTGAGQGVTAAVALEFVTSQCAGESVAWARCVTVALRAWLRYAHLEGLIPTPLAQAVPLPARWRLATAPTAVEPDALAAVLAACDRETAVGRRDYAVLVVLSRLGLRAGEVARLALPDVGWRDGVLRVVGKGLRVDLLPLPAEVGRTLEDYVRDGRPRDAGGALFRRIPAPHGTLGPSAVSYIVYRACDRAGLPRVGAHQLRHAAATGMRSGGASLPQIAQVLRHQSLTTTAAYARTDLAAQAPVVRPWPGGAS